MFKRYIMKKGLVGANYGGAPNPVFSEEGLVGGNYGGPLTPYFLDITFNQFKTLKIKRCFKKVKTVGEISLLKS